jgi:hypothetical protein
MNVYTGGKEKEKEKEKEKKKKKEKGKGEERSIGRNRAQKYYN